MIQSKRINIIVAVVMVFALIITTALVVVGNIQGQKGNKKTEPQYATQIFGTDIISIEIIADENDWQEMLDNAINEEYIMVDVVVNGTKFKNVGIRPKGNSSLTQVASSDSDRYSFRLQFDEYIKGQTCFGLESFVLNNMIGDNTYMKEYVSYDLMKEIGVDAPYFGFADIKLNGESWGLYLAVELYNESYEQRVFGDTLGMIYNVKSMDMGEIQPGKGMPNKINFDGMSNRSKRLDGGFQQRPDEETQLIPDREFQQMPNLQLNPDKNVEEPNTITNGNYKPNINQSTNIDRHMFPNPTNDGVVEMNQDPRGRGNFGGRGGPGSSGGSLEYVDDNIESYSAIFNNVVGKGTDSDFRRVVKALKALTEGRELETYFDIDQILRYLAAHTFVVNLDSYSSNMAQNYYIYERDGKITILPWDYNLAWGGFQNGNASSVINFPIDTPVSGVEMSSRPLIDKLLSNSEYLEKYHNYLQELINNYFANGKFEEKINSLDSLISNYVKNDVTAFCTFEEYNTAVSSFITLGNLRAESVQGQLNGTVPSTTSEQNKNPDKLIPAGNLKLSDLGSMMGGRVNDNGEFPRRMEGRPFGRMKQQSVNTANPYTGSVRVEESLGNNSFILTSVLVIVLIASIFFVAKLERKY